MLPIAQLFTHTLVLGASISAGYGTREGGIGAVLARKVNPEAKVTNLAKSGATSLQSTQHLDFKKYDPTVVVGFDLFFWDAMRMQTGASFEANTKKLFGEFQARGIPMIIAKVPVLELPFPAAQMILQNAKKVNALLTTLCQANPSCVLVDPLECYQEMADTSQYFIDGLHLNDKGNHFCAEYFLKAGHLDRL